MKTDNNKEEALLQRCAAHYTQGEYAMALIAINCVITLDANDATAHRWRGLCLTELRQFEEALKAYDRAIAINPNDATAHTWRGLCLTKLRQFEEALKAYDRAIDINSNDAAAHT